VSQIRLGLIGSSGRMGQALCAVLPGQPDIQLVASLNSDGGVAQLLAAAPDVVVDLSVGAAVDSHALPIVEAGLAYIIGATGYSQQTLASLERACAQSAAPVLVVPNFSLGASLMIRFAAQAARLMHSPVVVERHHQGKADAPSGTALFTAGRIAAARAAAELSDRPSTAAQYHQAADYGGTLGAAQAGVALHAIRGAGYLAEQEVSFTLPGESLRIEHRSIDRVCFMPGVLYAIRNIGRVRGLQVGLDTILEDSQPQGGMP
jgi:4-hydroxy-tetrahydrodipicolinate reductase